MHIVESINMLCKDAGTSLSAVEKDLGFGKGTIYRWNEKIPSVDKVQKVALYFKVSVDALLGHDPSNGADAVTVAYQKEVRMSLVARIKELCKGKDLSFQGLEAIVGLGINTIYKWDKTYPSADKLQKVAEYFDVSVDYLLGRDSSDKTDLAGRAPECKELTQIIEAVKVVQLLPQELMRLYGEVARLSVKLESLGEQNRELRAKNQELVELAASLRKQAKAETSLNKTGLER